MTVTSGSACNPDSFSVWASSSKSESFNISTFRVFCSMGSSQNFSQSIHFSCCTVSMLVTSRVKASPFKMFTVNSWAMAALILREQENKSPSKQLWRVTVKPSIQRSFPVTNIDMFIWTAFNLNSNSGVEDVNWGKWISATFQMSGSWILSTSVNMTCCCSAAWITSPLRPVRLEPGGLPVPMAFDQASLPGLRNRMCLIPSFPC